MPQEIRAVDRGGLPGPEDGHDDRQPDDDLAGGDDHGEERDDLAVEGLFTLPLATMTGERTRMLSVEGARVAVKNAQRNLRAMNLNDVDARAGDVSRTLDHVPAHLAKPNVVVLDPPRAGARAKVCRQIAAAGASSVVYIACDPTSLARDTATLIGEGYELKDIRAFDIYPMTHHVETVALFTR